VNVFFEAYKSKIQCAYLKIRRLMKRKRMVIKRRTPALTVRKATDFRRPKKYLRECFLHKTN